jgi:hypothetical protein
MLKKQVIGVLTALAIVVGSLSLSPVSTQAAKGSPSLSPVSTHATKIIPFSDPTPDPSFTLIESQNKTFDNSYVYSAVSGVVGAFVGVAIPGSLGVQVAGGVGSSEITNWIFNLLGAQTYVYAQLRMGISFNTYINRYTFVESVCYYTNDSFITPTSVQYADTNTIVPDATLAQWGLHNP